MSIGKTAGRYKIFEAVHLERWRQDNKHGPQLQIPIIADDDKKLIDHDDIIKRVFDRRFNEGTHTHTLILLEEVAEMVHAESLADIEKEAIEVAACAVKLVEAIRWQRATKP